jgi:hypothetical protein
LELWQSVQTLLAEADGVDPYLPAAQVAQAEHCTDGAAFSAWYVEPLHAVQSDNLVSKANPAEQKLQYVPVYDPDVWYFPVAQLLHTRLVVEVGDVLVYFPAAQEAKWLVHEVPVKSFSSWYWPEPQVLQARFAEAVGEVLEYIPLVQDAKWFLHTDPVKLFSAWYCPVSHVLHIRFWVGLGDVLVYFPAPHDAKWLLHDVPAKLFWFWYCPAGHAAHSRFLITDGTALAYLPTIHVDQAEHATLGAAFSAWYVDPGHAVQLVDLVLKAYPWEQKLQADADVDPVAVLYLPVAQLLQSLAASCPTTSLYVPLGQLEQVSVLCAVCALYFPLPQAVQAVVPELTPRPTVDDHRPATHDLQEDIALCWVWSPYLPATHDVQPYTVAALWLWYLPVAHAVQAAFSPEAAWPAVHATQALLTLISPVGQPAQRLALCVVQSVPVAGVPPDEHVHIFCLQLLCPISFWYLAAGQFLQSTESVVLWSWYLLCGHCVQLAVVLTYL